MTFKRIATVVISLLLCAPLVSLTVLTVTVSQLRNQLAQHETKVSTLDVQLGAARGQIEGMEAEAAAHVLQKKEDAQHQARASSLVGQLTDAHDEIERLWAAAAANIEVRGELAQAARDRCLTHSGANRCAW